jgi:hypothetical protein
MPLAQVYRAPTCDDAGGAPTDDLDRDGNGVGWPVVAPAMARLLSSASDIPDGESPAKNGPLMGLGHDPTIELRWSR